MSLTGVKKARGWKPFTVGGLLEVLPAEMAESLTADQVRPVLDEMVDSGDLRVSIVQGELRYRFAKQRASHVLASRLRELVPPDASVERVTAIPTVATLMDRARGGQPLELEPGRMRKLTATREELEAARDELLAALRELRRPTARNRPENQGMRVWVEETLREVRRSLRDMRPAKAEADTLCVTCRTRQRHFGDYCKRCCPPDERPTGKVT